MSGACPIASNRFNNMVRYGNIAVFILGKRTWKTNEIIKEEEQLDGPRTIRTANFFAVHLNNHASSCSVLIVLLLWTVTDT